MAASATVCRVRNIRALSTLRDRFLCRLVLLGILTCVSRDLEGRPPAAEGPSQELAFFWRETDFFFLSPCYFLLVTSAGAAACPVGASPIAVHARESRPGEAKPDPQVAASDLPQRRGYARLLAGLTVAPRRSVAAQPRCWRSVAPASKASNLGGERQQMRSMRTGVGQCASKGARKAVDGAA